MAGNGEWLPPGGSRLCRKQSSEVERKKIGDRAWARRLGPHSFLFFVICAILSYFFSHMFKTKAIKSTSNFIFSSFSDCMHLFSASCPSQRQSNPLIKNNKNSTIPLPNEEYETELGDVWGFLLFQKMLIKSVSVSPC